MADPSTTEFKKIKVIPLHPTFAAEIQNVDLANIDNDTLAEVRTAIDKYGVCIFRDTGLTDATHVSFSRKLGELDDIKRYIGPNRKMRYGHYELFDAGNMDDDGNLLDPNSAKFHAGLGNRLWHTDSSFNPRRASYSLLRAVEIPPPGNGGNTEFADARTAFAELPEALREELLAKNYVGAHTFAQSRKAGSPEYWSDLNPRDYKMARHRIVQMHEPSGRLGLYVGAHLHHIEGLPEEKSNELRDFLNAHVTQERYAVAVEWRQPGDLMVWDNRAVLHRAMGGSFENRYRRDMRRTTVHDASSTAWGLNEVGEKSVGFQPALMKKGEIPAEAAAKPAGITV